MGDQNDNGREPGSPTAEQKEAESNENTGPIKCAACEQVYAGPSSLKRHLWRIHRMAGEEAQAVVDASVLDAQDNPDDIHEETEEEDTTNNGGGTEVKPLLAVSLSSSAAPKVRSLLDFSPDPPGYQSNNFGGVSPTAPWTGGASGPQSGLLPTPGGGGQGMLQGYVPQQKKQKPQPQPQPEPTDDTGTGGGDSGTESGDGKIKPLMSVGVLSEGGIPSLMSIPFGFCGGMGMSGGYQSRPRRKERRSKPYGKRDGRDITSGEQDNGGNQGDDRTECTECGEQFQDSADLADHEINSHNVGIDLNCDVELTA